MKIRTLAPALFTTVCLGSQPPALAADAPAPRIALVVGNSHYVAGPLVNPVKDAKAMAERLQAAGFKVTLKLDASRQGLTEAVRQFGNDIGGGRAVGVFYYAGHGVQLNWRNFLVPVDARIRNRADVQSQTVDLGLLMDALNRARNPLNLVILDACRNNPFGPDFRVDDKGLSQLDAPPGTLLAYATAPGNTADDGEGEHGLYTDRLLQEMQVPGAAVEDVFKRVRLAVRRNSAGGQIPWESTSLEQDFAFIAGAPKTADVAHQEFQADLATWQSLRQSGDVTALESFLRQRPSGQFSELAQHRLDQLLRQKGEKTVRAAVSYGPAKAQEVCAPSPAVEAEAVPFKVGERYGYRKLDLVSGQETGRQQYSIAAIEGDEVRHSDGKTVSDLFGNNVRAPDGRRWTPYQFFIQDYALGKRWPARFIVTNAEGKQVEMDFQLRVAARERITLPAGTFDALRIEARGANLANGAGLERTAWVAPGQMRGFVAMESLTRKDGRIVEGERLELTEHGMESKAVSGFGSY